MRAVLPQKAGKSILLVPNITEMQVSGNSGTQICYMYVYVNTAMFCLALTNILAFGNTRYSIKVPVYCPILQHFSTWDLKCIFSTSLTKGSLKSSLASKYTWRPSLCLKNTCKMAVVCAVAKITAWLKNHVVHCDWHVIRCIMSDTIVPTRWRPQEKGWLPLLVVYTPFSH